MKQAYLNQGGAESGAVNPAEPRVDKFGVLLGDDGKRHRVPGMSSNQMLAEVCRVWPHLTQREQIKVVRGVRDTATIRIRFHQSKLPAVDEKQPRLLSRGEAAEKLGIKLDRLDAWRKRGWITGEVKLSNTIHFPPEAVAKAKRAAKRRAARPRKRGGAS